VKHETYAPPPPPPWDDYDAPGTSPCWIHHCNEPVTRSSYVVCFECGHVWTARALRKAVRQYRRQVWLSDPFRADWFGARVVQWMKASWVQARKVWSCPVCAHDF
jgi:hypothetical protein